MDIFLFVILLIRNSISCYVFLFTSLLLSPNFCFLLLFPFLPLNVLLDQFLNIPLLPILFYFLFSYVRFHSPFLSRGNFYIALFFFLFISFSFFYFLSIPYHVSISPFCIRSLLDFLFFYHCHHILFFSFYPFCYQPSLFTIYFSFLLLSLILFLSEFFNLVTIKYIFDFLFFYIINLLFHSYDEPYLTPFLYIFLFREDFFYIDHFYTQSQSSTRFLFHLLTTALFNNPETQPASTLQQDAQHFLDEFMETHSLKLLALNSFCKKHI